MHVLILLILLVLLTLLVLLLLRGVCVCVTCSVLLNSADIAVSWLTRFSRCFSEERENENCLKCYFFYKRTEVTWVGQVRSLQFVFQYHRQTITDPKLTFLSV